MDVNIDNLNRLNELIGVHFHRKHVLVVEPEKNEKEEQIGEDIVYDKVPWKISEELQEHVNELTNNDEMNTEDKILDVFDFICKNYTYDDNLISYIRKIDDDTFTLPDWYGRDIDEEWEKNREGHNRRICFELSRYLAKSLKELLKDKKDYEVCIHWDKGLTHYFVGLTCDDYSVALDTDNFFNIKDLTRLKTDLTAEGIVILEDEKNKFKTALDKFNQNKGEHAIIKIQEDIDEANENKSNEDVTEIEENEDVEFFKKALEVLMKKYKIDSQGIYESMKEIVDTRLGSKDREKVWKKIEGETNESTRYIRCLVLNIENQKYLIDVDQGILRPFDEKEFEEKKTHFLPYKELSRGNYDYYDGR